MSPLNPGASFYPAIDPEYLAGLRRRKQVIERLCGALQEFLAADLDEAIKRAERPPSMATMAFSPEILAEAVGQRDQIQSQIESLDNLADELPEAQADFLVKMQRPMLESQLKQADSWISQIQKHLEAQQS